MGPKRSVILLISLVMLLCFGCKEHNRELEEVINAINKNFDKINTYIADYSIKEGGDLIFIGKITFVKPDLTRLEVLNPQTKKLQSIIYYDNNLKYLYFPQGKQAIKERLVKKSNKKFNFIYHSVSCGEEIISLVYNGKAKIGQEDFFELTATMGTKGKGALANIYTFLIDANTGCIRKFSYRDHKTGKEVSYEFENYKINVPIDRKKVELILPSDAMITQIN